VILHEMGHTLGIMHSSDRTSVMFPYYSAKKLQLTTDDINAIQALYGSGS